MRFSTFTLLCLIGSVCLFSWSYITCAQDMAALTDKIGPKVAKLRELPFLNDVKKTFQFPEELQQVLLTEIERTYPGDTLHSLEKRLLKFGFVVSPINLQQMIIRLLSQQIAGYYDLREKKMVLIVTVPGSFRQGTAIFPLEYLSKFVIKGMGYSLEEILLSHELTHVLQDQHFDLLALPIEDLDPEDMASATRALIEGDATLVMLDYMLERQGTDCTQVPELSDTLHSWTNSPFVRGFSLFQTIPGYIIDNLLFSYIYGFDFVLYLKQRGGWELVNQAYYDFPVSTEQILHPEKYLDDLDYPTTIRLPTLPESFSVWRELECNTLGEFNISILIDGFFSAAQARLASAGWDGDRFCLYENIETEQLLLVWHTVWDTQQDAQEFFQIYSDVIEKRYAKKFTISSKNSSITSLDRRLWNTDDGDIYMEIRGTNVLILDGVPGHLLKDLLLLFWND